MSQLTLPSPAKLNLFLHITGKRTDGYHNLQSVFQLIDLYDYLSFDINHTSLSINQLDDVASEDNLIIKAARLLKQHTGYSGGCRIELQKNVPIGGGVGGGSSNAATTLLALNTLWQTGLTLTELAKLGIQLGADVPIFILGKNAWAEGVGERLVAVDLPQIDYIVLKPDCFISTKQLFSQESLTRNTPETTFAAYQQNPTQFGNNFEAIAQKLYPEVAQALAYLNQFGQARLTGTGACVFLPVQPEQDVTAIMQNTPCKSYFCHGLQNSPVHEQLGLV
ncbi:4-(cytidine 5'-diphospho)-2-C-methyl-D-erythritol kinase [Alkanindiges illinoisensis]|uniref:4-diphosphocytidyl-2-C-methyl-D-erythritol kinase n=1 Tax=Alkanindiges illinoisensis TaxID=197183 RepID=A0A4Y7XEE3_9GAMM|nr:4-(cytidine 5'-diphospho)-2-C-methyl-D-erythritol kinase [Alkanindiges illinoisensis]TEU30019.1 4-(cytidine 5'-diphospho)-2-C-methyl-D-erythritol kinase [Alkanindiges illinoisensis]